MPQRFMLPESFASWLCHAIPTSDFTPVLTIGGATVRRVGDLFSLNDLHKASGDNPNQRPGEFVRNQQTQELVAELSNAGISAIETRRGGNGGGTYNYRNSGSCISVPARSLNF